MKNHIIKTQIIVCKTVFCLKIVRPFEKQTKKLEKIWLSFFVFYPRKNEKMDWDRKVSKSFIKVLQKKLSKSLLTLDAMWIF